MTKQPMLKLLMQVTSWKASLLLQLVRPALARSFISRSWTRGCWCAVFALAMMKFYDLRDFWISCVQVLFAIVSLRWCFVVSSIALKNLKEFWSCLSPWEASEPIFFSLGLLAEIGTFVVDVVSLEIVIILIYQFYLSTLHRLHINLYFLRSVHEFVVGVFHGATMRVVVFCAR